MTPLELYQQKLDANEISENYDQRKVISILESIYFQLIKRQKIRESQLGQLRRKIKPRQPIKGLYLWGNVGIGKTFMIDLFYSCLPVRKMRLHFHPFMQRIQQLLKESQGEKNPLEKIARQIADDVVIICFDEFFVSDIADAMILSELFRALFQGGVCLVTTSNIPPDALYKNGIQREQFLPAIDLIKHNVRTIHLASTTDYRLDHIKKAGLYYTPINKLAETNMTKSFICFSNTYNANTKPVIILDRPIEVIKKTAKTIWFDFDRICGRPRSQDDYLVLVTQYDTFLIGNVPVLDHCSPDLILSFINLIDVLYDAHKRVIISAAAPANELYHGKTYQLAFKRTKSRLIEMQSDGYMPSALEDQQHHGKCS